MLNSFWGKFGKQSNKFQVETFGSPAKFYQLLNNDELLILRVRVVNPEMLGVVNNHIQEAGAIQPHINIFFACFTTRQARLMSTRPFPHEAWTGALHGQGSTIYKCSAGLPELPTVSYLGLFKDELTEKDTIVEFAAAGPQNYGYRTRQGKVECKVRGFSLNVRGKEQLNFDLLKQNVLDEIRLPQEATLYSYLQLS